MASLEFFFGNYNLDQAEELYLDPHFLKHTQDSECPSISHVSPYDENKDPGIHVGVDEDEEVWVLDGHRRVAAARIGRRKVKIGSWKSVSASDMWDLAEG